MRPVRLPGPVKGLRIGLFGGSFNPAHTGHLHVAETAMKRLQLDWVWWIVARGNPLKTGHGDFGEAERVYTYSSQYLEARARIFTFPGFHLAKAIELAIVGSHYRTVVDNVLMSDEASYTVA